MHEESVGVPLFIHWNGLAKPHSRSSELVSTLDLHPTILELAGLPKPGSLPGVSLAPMLKYGLRRSLRPYVTSECVGVGGVKGTGHRMVRTHRWKYILTGTNDEALFDEVKDPYELENVVSNKDNRAELRRMRFRLNEWMVRVGDTHPRPPMT
jgi:arylsulfatase A-like enzyme